MLNPIETNLLRSALGLTHRSKITYRNRFLAGYEDIPRWRRLVARGLAREGAKQDTNVWFSVTREGFEAVKRQGDKLGPDEDAQMARWDAKEARAS